MNKKQATAIEAVLDMWDGHISSHSESCWKWHVACFATLVQDLEEEE